MSYNNVSSIEQGNLELCKEQFAITHPTFTVSTLAAVVAYDQSADFALGRYYACIFERAGLRNTPKLLMKGIHQESASDAIKALLHKLSWDVGNMVGADLRTFQMSEAEWRGSRDFTTDAGSAGVGVSGRSGVSSRSGWGARRQVGHEELPPPAYRK